MYDSSNQNTCYFKGAEGANMGTRAWFAGSVVAVLLIMSAEASAAAGVTFTKDVLPILQKNCQTCHRPGNIAPMSFLSMAGLAILLENRQNVFSECDPCCR